MQRARQSYTQLLCVGRADPAAGRSEVILPQGSDPLLFDIMELHVLQLYSDRPASAYS